MKLVTFSVGAGQRVGVVDPQEPVLRDLTGVLPGATDMLGLIESWSSIGPALNRQVPRLSDIPLASVDLLAPLPVPRRNIFCVGKNYRDHATEFGLSGYDTSSQHELLPDRPILFTKATTAVVGPDSVVDLHEDLTREVDYEGELAVVIGQPGRRISRDDAHRHVWGYTILNDVTARDLQRDHKQWLLGKSLDTHCPMGPYAVTADEIVDVTALELRTQVNGHTRQHATVKDLIFDIPELIATLSAGITLLPGDVIATGTPAGVGIGSTPPRFLEPGDVVEISITGLGTLRNEFRASSRM